MKFNKLNLFLFVFALLVALISFFLGSQGGQTEFYLSNALICLICLIGLGSMPGEPFSLKKTVFIFFLIFFGFIPLNDIANQNLYWNGASIKYNYYVTTNIYILLGLIFFIIGCRYKINVIYRSKFFNLKNCTYPDYKYFAILIFSFIVFIFIIREFNYSLNDILLRTKDSSLICAGVDCHEGSLTSEFFDYFIRPIPFLIFLIYWSLRPRLKMLWFSTMPGIIGIILLFLAIISAMPTAIPRFLVAALYIPLIIFLFKKIFIKKFIFTISIIGGLFIVFPFLDNFRYFYSPYFEIGINFDFLNHGHFDAYQNFVRAVSIDLITYGNQLLGAILFWFPRSYWPDKPEGTGFLLANLENLSLNNISFPLIAEGYVNFGISGVMLFCFLLGLFLSNVDRAFWRDNKYELSGLSTVPYLLSFGLLFMLLRGNLLSSLAYSVGVLASFLFCLGIIYFILKYNTK